MEYITLTNDNIKNISERNVILCTFSEMGAEGNPSMIYLFVGNNKEVVCYNGNYAYGEVKLNALKKKFSPINSFMKAENTKGYQYEYLGSGNHLFINNNGYFTFKEMVGNSGGPDIYDVIPEIAEKIFIKQSENNSKNYNLIWSREGLNNQKLGTFCEYYAKMALTSYGMSVYSSEVDDHGIDFVTESKRGFLKFQVKSIRLESTRYVFVHEKDFDITDENMYMFLIILADGEHPDCYIIPATAWVDKENEGNSLFVHHPNYKEPEYGLNISDKNLAKLQKYRMSLMINSLI